MRPKSRVDQAAVREAARILLEGSRRIEARYQAHYKALGKPSPETLQRRTELMLAAYGAAIVLTERIVEEYGDLVFYAASEQVGYVNGVRDKARQEQLKREIERKNPIALGLVPLD